MYSVTIETTSVTQLLYYFLLIVVVLHNYIMHAQ